MTRISEATRDRALSDLSRHYASGTIDLVDLEAFPWQNLSNVFRFCTVVERGRGSKPRPRRRRRR